MRWLLLLVLPVTPAAAATDAPRLVPDASVVWRDDAPGFGGWSGLKVRDGGGEAVAIGDHGSWATVRLDRRDGRLTAAETTGFGPLRAISGAPLQGEDTDAEGLALDAAGRAYIAFERFHRIRRYDRIDGSAAAVPGDPAFARLQHNSGLEAVAIDAGGALYAIPERSGALTRPFPVYRLSDGRWDRRLSIPREGPFLVVDADFGPDGQLYVLERAFGWFSGFASRIRRFRLGPDGLDSGITLLQTPAGGLDDFEGISVWRDAEGHTRATLISDDNFNVLQQTVVAEYLLAGG